MKRHRHLLYGGLASSLVGAVCLLVTDFAGWTEQIVRYDPSTGTYDYSYIDHYVYVGSGDAPTSASVVLIAVAATLAYSSVCALMAANGTVDDTTARHLKHARLAALGAAAGLTVAGILFDVLIDYEEAYDWWLDIGFYGGLAGGALAATLLSVAGRSVHRGGSRSTYTAPAQAQPHPTRPPHRAGWYADPTGRHQHRWWDGQRWSADVADHGVTTSDPVLARPQPR